MTVELEASSTTPLSCRYLIRGAGADIEGGKL